jgi:hypothetical protein
MPGLKKSDRRAEKAANSLLCRSILPSKLSEEHETPTGRLLPIEFGGEKIGFETSSSRENARSFGLAQSAPPKDVGGNFTTRTSETGRTPRRRPD